MRVGGGSGGLSWLFLRLYGFQRWAAFDGEATAAQAWTGCFVLTHFLHWQSWQWALDGTMEDHSPPRPGDG